jgi:hypothetical protein
VLLALAALFAAGLGVRRYILDVQRQMAGVPLPFTLEGAIHFHRIQQVLAPEGLPGADRHIEYPRGIRVRATDTVTDTYLVAALTPLFPAAVSLAERVRWIEGIWFCLGIPLLALWLRLLTRSWWAGLAAAAFYAVTLSSVIRSTGQEISHENFALPLLLGSLAASAWALQAEPRGRFLRRALLAAALLALAQMTWDLVQFFLFLSALALGGRVLFGRAPLPAREAELAGWQVLALGLAGALNPYLRAHGYLYSLPLLLLCGVLLAHLARQRFQGLETGPAGVSKVWKTRLLLLLVALVPAVIGVLLARNYGSSYSHFGELLVAKLRFLQWVHWYELVSVKPADPALLTFDQRILWVPALHSATWSLTKHLFPAIFATSLVALACVARRKNEDRNSNLMLPLVGAIVSFVAYWLFVRLHVFTALFFAALLGAWVAWAVRRGALARAVVGVLLLLALVAEAGNTLRLPEKQGRLGVPYRELNELTAWLRAHVAPAPVLANFGVSAAVLTYGGCPILLHPKFEAPQIRERVRRCNEVLFKETEDKFRDWAEREGALYYVHELGEYGPEHVEQQMRYMVDALQPRTDTAAWLLDREPNRLRCFAPVWGNAKYRVYRIVRSDDATIAAEQAELAALALQHGKLERAECHAIEALARAPDHRPAQAVLRHVLSLKQQGFGAHDDAKK